ncbi:MAG TPA: hypothetical protein V6D11_15430 [Waterburya sp.]
MQDVSIPILVLATWLGCSTLTLAAHPAMSLLGQSSPASAPTPKATKPATLPDTLVIPGERVGSVARHTTRQDLAKRFGAARLTDQPISIGEGFTEPGTRVNLGSEFSFSIVWADSMRTQPKEIRNLGSGWRTPQGIGVGTPLAQLQQKLGLFKFYGFAWDYGGTVLLEGTELAKYEDLLILRLRTAPDAAQRSPNDFKALIGERQFSSNNSHLPPLKPTVGEMIVRLASKS